MSNPTRPWAPCPKPEGKRRTALITRLLLLLIATGASALILEVSWIRRLTLLVGGTTFSVSLVVSVFLGGLGLGSWFAGRLADRLSRPLLAYGIAQLGVAGFAACFPSGVSLFEPWVGTRTDTSSRLLVGAILILPSTLCMGATFPFLCRFALDSSVSAAVRVGQISGFGTLGAAAGALLAGLWLIPRFGLNGAMGFAIVVDLAVAAVVIPWSLKLPGQARPTQVQDSRREELPHSSPEMSEDSGFQRGALAPMLLLGCAAGSGFVGLALQVLWSRSLAFFLGGVTFTYSSVLATYLLGTCLGQILIPRIGWVRRNPWPSLAWLHGLIALVAVLPLRGRWVDDLFRRLTDVGGSPLSSHAFAIFGATLVFVLLPTFLLGGTFPLFAGVLVTDLGRRGKSSARLYAWSQVGGVLGSLGVGLVVLGLLGLKGGTLAVCALSTILSLSFVLTGPPIASGRLYRPLQVGFALLCLGGAFFLARPTRPVVLDSHVFRGKLGERRELVDFREGPNAAVTVVDNQGGGLGLYTDGFEAAGTGDAYRYMRLLGHLPVLLSSQPDRVLVIGFGSGTTAGAIALHPQVGELEIAEISEEVLEVGDRFRDVNHGVLERDNVRTWVEDGRRVLFSPGEPYDIISLEPLMPYTPAAVHLYTEDFYALSRSRLETGGILCQWIPIHSIAPEDCQILVKSFLAVFPEGSLWAFEHSLLLLGVRGEFSIPFASFFAGCRQDGVRESLEDAGLLSPYDVLSGLVLGPEEAAEFAGEEVRSMTDDRPVLEFRPLPRFALTTYLAGNLSRLLDSVPPDLASHLDLGEVPAESRSVVQREFDLYSRSMRMVLKARIENCLAVYSSLVGRSSVAVEHKSREDEALRVALAINPRNRIAEKLLED